KITQQSGKTVIFQIFPVPTCMDTRQHDLLVTGFDQHPRLPQHTFRSTAAHESPGPRNDTERTEIVATFLNFEKCPGLMSKVRNIQLLEFSRLHNIAHRIDRLASMLNLLHQGNYLVPILGTDDEIYTGDGHNF